MSCWAPTVSRAQFGLYNEHEFGESLKSVDAGRGSPNIQKENL